VTQEIVQKFAQKADEKAAREAAEKAVRYINENMVAEGKAVSLIGVKKQDGLYKFKIKTKRGDFDYYVTKQGKLLFLRGFDLDAPPPFPRPKQVKASPPPEKRDIPEGKLFVMTYCPFGIQAQKMFLPVYALLKDKARMGICFVDYVMHGEKEIREKLRQYCLQKEEKEKYYQYLNCFVESKDSDACLIKAGIDRGKLETCISETDKQYHISSARIHGSTDVFPNLARRPGLIKSMG